MNYRLFELCAVGFGLYFLYAAYKGYPSILSNYLMIFRVKHRRQLIDKMYNAFSGVGLLVLAVFLEMKYQSLSVV